MMMRAQGCPSQEKKSPFLISSTLNQVMVSQKYQNHQLGNRGMQLLLACHSQKIKWGMKKKKKKKTKMTKMKMILMRITTSLKTSSVKDYSFVTPLNPSSPLKPEKWNPEMRLVQASPARRSCREPFLLTTS